MLNEFDTKILLEKFYPGVKVKAWAQYQDLYLFIVEHPSVEEKDWDPYFSVNSVTGEVQGFSILIDDRLSEISKLKWNDI